MASRRLLAAFGVVVLALIATSRPVRVGDAREYFAMALNLSRLQAPSLSPADITLAQRRLDELRFGGLPLAIPALRGADGRQDFFHFWFYPTLAVPGIWLTDAVGLHPNYGFAALNVLLFLSALWLVSNRAAWWVTAVAFCSPVLWWIDKCHTEVFTFSLVAAGCVLLRDAPWWSMICFGAASTQNPPIAVLVPLVAVAAPLLRGGAWRDSRLWIGAAMAGALALLHPMYYQWRLGVVDPQLLGGVEVRMPTINELGAVVWDPNLGLLFQVPVLVLAFLGGAAALARRPASWVRVPEVWLVLAGAGIFLVSFAQTPNFNHGGTPGISRYTLWLIALAIPILQRAAVLLSTRARRWFVVLALASCLWCVVGFRPSLPERYQSPTWVAGILWERWPWLDNPLPEVFSERLSGSDAGLLPVATPGCTKVLLIGARWPVPCFPEPAPEACLMPEAICYANRNDGGYAFVAMARPVGQTFDRQRQRSWVWNQDPRSDVRQRLARLRWQDLRRVSPSGPGAMVRATQNLSWTYCLQSDEELFVYVAEPGQGANLTLRLPATMAGSIFDPQGGGEIRPVRVETQPWGLASLPVPPGRAAAVVLARVR